MTTMGLRRHKKMTEVDVEEQVSHQQTLPSTKKTCPTSVKKKTIVKTDCNRKIKKKEYSKYDKKSYKVCKMMSLHASQLLLTLPCFIFE